MPRRLAIPIAIAALAIVSGWVLFVGLPRYQRAQQPFGSGLVALGRQEGAYLSAQLKPREQRTAAELHRDIQDVLLAHNSRSENLRRTLVMSRSQPA